jgi:hypothetical protein
MSETTDNSAIVNIRAQRGLCVGYLIDGDWVFTLCSMGLKQTLGVGISKGDNLLVRFKAHEVKNNPNSVTIKVQHHLLVGWLTRDTGKYIFTLDRHSISELIGRELKTDELLEVIFTGEIIGDNGKHGDGKLYIKDTGE